MGDPSRDMPDNVDSESYIAPLKCYQSKVVLRKISNNLDFPSKLIASGKYCVKYVRITHHVNPGLHNETYLHGG